MIESVSPSRTSHVIKSRTQTSPMLDLIDTGDISIMLGLSRSHVVGRITKRPDFPAPVINLSQRVRRWLRVDVEGWVLSASRK